MRHVGQKKSLGPVGLLRRGRPDFQCFIFLNAVNRPLNQPQHQKDKDAAAQQNGSYHQIRLSHQPDHQIPGQKQYQQHNRRPKQPPFLVQVSIFPHLSGKKDITINVESHQKASRKDHPLVQRQIQLISPLPAKTPSYIFRRAIPAFLPEVLSRLS